MAYGIFKRCLIKPRLRQGLRRSLRRRLKKGLKPSQGSRRKDAFKKTLGIYFFLGWTSALYASGMAVFDASSFARLGSMASTAGQSLSQLQSMVGEIHTLNSVLGNRLPQGLFKHLGTLDQYSGNLGSVLNAVGGQGGDPLSELNYMTSHQGGVRDFSDVLYARDYFKEKFFSDEKNMVSLSSQETVQQNRQQGFEEVTLNSLSLSTQQKKTLKADHEVIEKIGAEASRDSTLVYQTNIQTKLLQEIAKRLDKLILLHSQQLQLLSTFMVQGQPTVFKTVGKIEKRKKTITAGGFYGN